MQQDFFHQPVAPSPIRKGLQGERNKKSTGNVVVEELCQRYHLCSTLTPNLEIAILDNCEKTSSHTIHVWYIHLHWVDFYGKCRQIFIYTIHGWYGVDGEYPKLIDVNPILNSTGKKRLQQAEVQLHAAMVDECPRPFSLGRDLFESKDTGKWLSMSKSA